MTPTLQALKPAMVLAAVLALAGYFGLSQIQKSAQKPMWGDELYTLERNVRVQSWSNFLRHGAGGQGSPAPLDYLLIKILDSAKVSLQYLNLHPLAYYRLSSHLGSLASGLLVALMMWKLCRPAGLLWIHHALLLIATLTVYWFQFYTYFFSAEMRPYALWNGLTLVTLASFFAWPRWKLLTFFGLCSLAFTATASVFQLMAMGVAFGIVRRLEHRTFREIIREALVLFILPSLIAYYYCPKGGNWGYLDAGSGTWNQYWAFWLGKEHVWILCGLSMALCMFRTETRRLMIPSLSLLILYVMGPLIYYLTRKTGFFFSDRQFIYYELDVPLFLMTVALCLPSYSRQWLRTAGLGIVVALSVGTSLVFTQFMKWPRADWSLRGTRAMPIDTSGRFQELLKKELPRGFCLTDPPDPTLDTIGSLRIVGDALLIRYPAHPIGTQTVFVKHIYQGQNAEVTAITSQPCANGVFLPLIHGQPVVIKPDLGEKSHAR